MNLKKRLITVGVFGHVDHGKTTLLDKLSGTSKVYKEFGNITQAIAPQEIVFENVKVVFLDTPGHEAFTNMRKIISQVVDFGFILISKKDGFMPQTQECLSFLLKNKIKHKALLSKSDIVVSLKKHIIKQFNTSKVELSRCIPISTVTKLNLKLLLKVVLYVSKKLQFYNKKTLKAYILDVFLVKGLGVQTLVIVKSGSFRVGSFVKTNTTLCKVKSILNFSGTKGGSCILKISGWGSKPKVGELIWVLKKQDSITPCLEVSKTPSVGKKKFDLNSLFSQQKEKLHFILKADNEGGLKALNYVLKEVFDKLINIKCSVLYGKVGVVCEDDLKKSNIFKSPIVYFSSSAYHKTLILEGNPSFPVFKSNVIYKLLEGVKDYVFKQDQMCSSEVPSKATFVVKKVFKKGKSGVYILGCQLLTGSLVDSKKLSLYRNELLVCNNIEILNLKLYKDKVNLITEVNQEFGIKVNSTFNIPEGVTLKQS